MVLFCAGGKASSTGVALFSLLAAAVALLSAYAAGERVFGMDSWELRIVMSIRPWGLLQAPSPLSGHAAAFIPLRTWLSSPALALSLGGSWVLGSPHFLCLIACVVMLLV